MKKFLSIYLSCFISVLFTSCEKATPVELEVLFYNKVAETKTEKFPKYLQDICQPIVAIGDKKNDYSFTPITFKRVDLNIRFEMDYLRNKAGDPSKIKFVQRELKNYFKDSSVCEILTLPNVNSLSIQKQIENIKDKKNRFVFSSDEYFTIADKEIYHSVGDLRTAVSKYLSENKVSKIYIDYEPQITIHIPNDLENIFQQIIDLNVSPDERMMLIPDFLTQSFANNSTIEEFGENGTRVGITSSEEYFNQIIMSSTIDNIEILEAKKNTEGKYWTVKIIEHHKLSK